MGDAEEIGTRLMNGPGSLGGGTWKESSIPSMDQREGGEDEFR